MSRRVFALCALSVGILSGAACQASAGRLSDEDRTALHQNDERFATATNARNFATAASLYLEDAAVLPPNGESVQGRQRIQKFLSDFPPISDFKLDPVDIDGRGDLAYVRGNYAMTISPPGAPPIHERGKYLEIWRKQEDGSWKMKWDIFNSDLAAAGQ
jgi:uncharacterized protein (TIGR02246 family)